MTLEHFNVFIINENMSKAIYINFERYVNDFFVQNYSSIENGGNPFLIGLQEFKAEIKYKIHPSLFYATATLLLVEYCNDIVMPMVRAVMLS